MKSRDLGDMLVSAGLLTEQQLEMTRDFQKKTGGSLRMMLAKLGFVTDRKLTEFIAEKEGLPIAEVDTLFLPVELVRTIPEEMIKKNEVLPIGLKENVIMLAMSDPLNYDVIEQVQFVTGKRVEVHLASHDAMAKAITQLMDNQFDEALKDIKSDPSIKPHREPTSSASGLKKPLSEGELRRASGGKVVGTSKKWEELAPALIPVLIEKGVITEADLRLKLAAMKAARPHG